MCLLYPGILNYKIMSFWCSPISMSMQLGIISVDYTAAFNHSSSSQVFKTRNFRVTCNMNLFSTFLLIALKEDICTASFLCSVFKKCYGSQRDTETIIMLSNKLIKEHNCHLPFNIKMQHPVTQRNDHLISKSNTSQNYFKLSKGFLKIQYINNYINF